MINAATTSNYDISADQPNRMWFEDGILYINFNQPVNLASVEALSEDSKALIHAQGLTLAPMIAYFTNAGKEFKFALSDIGKVTSLQPLNMASAIISVGLDGSALKMSKLANKLFYSDRIKYFDTLEEARQSAEPYKHAMVGIFEQDRFK